MTRNLSDLYPGLTPLSAGDGIDITDSVASVKVDGVTVDFNSAKELEVIGGGGGDSFPTGMVTQTISASAPDGWILLTGASAIRTIGNGNSGADRANADTENLFKTLWDSMADAQAAVSGGRGENAAADFAADKTLTIPDPRGRALIGTGTGGGLAARTHGATGGAETHQLSVAELAAHSHARYAQATGSGSSAPIYAAANGAEVDFGTNGSQGSDTAHANMQPWLALNLICKL